MTEFDLTPRTLPEAAAFPIDELVWSFRHAQISSVLCMLQLGKLRPGEVYDVPTSHSGTWQGWDLKPRCSHGTGRFAPGSLAHAWCFSPGDFGR